MLRSWACVWIVVVWSVVQLGNTVKAQDPVRPDNLMQAADPAEAAEPADAADPAEAADATELYIYSRGPAEVAEPANTAPPAGTAQPDSSEWLVPELLPQPEEVTPSVVEGAVPATTPATDAVYKPIEPIEERLTKIEVAAQAPPTHRLFREFWGYRVSEHSVSWTMGDGDQFGNFSFDPNPYLKSGATWGIHGGLGVKFLSGPQRSDMPPRVFDISLGLQKRKVVGDLAYDASCAVLAATDFEGSCRDGIRFPAHAVGYYTLTPEIDLVFGVDYLDRDDVRVLPVGGLILRPDPDVRVELVFPRPRVELQLTPDYRLYFRGELGGGTWAVERDSQLDDLASLYELEFGVGVAHKGSEGDWGASEIVYLFDRRLEYESGLGDYDIGPTLMLRLVTLY